jgi:hypothetical protein
MYPGGFGQNGYDYMGNNNPNFNNVGGGGYDGSGQGPTFQGDQDWLTLPLDPLLNQWGADITQGAMGPEVSGMDMLDILLNIGGPPGTA